jgi:hypothetical protein
MLCQWHKVLAVSKALQHSSGRNNRIFLSFVYFSNSELQTDIHAFIIMKACISDLNVVKKSNYSCKQRCFAFEICRTQL